MFLPACATNGTIRSENNMDYSAFIGNNSSYSDTESKASGGATNSKDAHYKAKLAINKGDYDQALYYYVKALEFNQKDIPALIAIAKIHTLKDNLAPTLLAYKMVLDIDNNNIIALEGEGLALLKAGKALQAKDMLDKANNLESNRPLTLMGLAVYNDLVADFNKSKEYYLASAKLAPKSVKILNNYGYSRYLAGDWEDAENTYKKLLRQDPNHTQGILNYGLLLARKGETDRALQEFKKVMTESEAYNELGYIYMMEQDYEKAKRLYEMAISASPTYFDKATKNLEQLKVLVSEYTKPGITQESNTQVISQDQEMTITKDILK